MKIQQTFISSAQILDGRDGGLFQMISDYLVMYYKLAIKISIETESEINWLHSSSRSFKLKTVRRKENKVWMHLLLTP